MPDELLKGEILMEILSIESTVKYTEANHKNVFRSHEWLMRAAI